MGDAVELTDSTFSQALKAPAAVVDFWSPTCLPCMKFKPVFEDVAVQMASSTILMATVNADNATATLAQYAIDSLPTQLYLLKGQEVHRTEGNISRDQLVDEIARAFPDQVAQAFPMPADQGEPTTAPASPPTPPDQVMPAPAPPTPPDQVMPGPAPTPPAAPSTPPQVKPSPTPKPATTAPTPQKQAPTAPPSQAPAATPAAGGGFLTTPVIVGGIAGIAVIVGIVIASSGK